MVTRHPRLPLLRSGLLLAGCVSAVAAAWSLASPPLTAVIRPVATHGPAALADLPFADVLAGGCAAVLLGCVLWLVGAAGLVALSRAAHLLAPGSATVAALGRLAERSCPAVTRGVVTASLGFAVSAGVAGPALADPSVGPVGQPGSSGLSGLALPDRADGSPPATRASRTAPPRTARAVVVHPGDSLWSIAAGLLAPDADDAAVTDAWHRLHHANASRVGADPDLILPGTRLVVPDDVTTPGKESQ